MLMCSCGTGASLFMNKGVNYFSQWKIIPTFLGEFGGLACKCTQILLPFSPPNPQPPPPCLTQSTAGVQRPGCTCAVERDPCTGVHQCCCCCGLHHHHPISNHRVNATSARISCVGLPSHCSASLGLPNTSTTPTPMFTWGEFPSHHSRKTKISTKNKDFHDACVSWTAYVGTSLCFSNSPAAKHSPIGTCTTSDACTGVCIQCLTPPLQYTAVPPVAPKSGMSHVRLIMTSY